MGLELANTIFGLSRVGGIFVVLIAGFLVDRYGVRRLLFLVLLITGLSSTGLALAQVVPLLVAMLFVQATASAAFFPVALVATSKLTTVYERSTFTGTTIAIGIVVGLGITPALLGAVADAWSFLGGILGLGVLTAMSCVALRYLQKT